MRQIIIEQRAAEFDYDGPEWPEAVFESASELAQRFADDVDAAVLRHLLEGSD